MLWALGLASGAVLDGYIRLLLLIAVAVVLMRVNEGHRRLQMALTDPGQSTRAITLSGDRVCQRESAPFRWAFNGSAFFFAVPITGSFDVTSGRF